MSFEEPTRRPLTKNRQLYIYYERTVPYSVLYGGFNPVRSTELLDHAVRSTGRLQFSRHSRLVRIVLRPYRGVKRPVLNSVPYITGNGMVRQVQSSTDNGTIRPSSMEYGTAAAFSAFSTSTTRAMALPYRTLYCTVRRDQSTTKYGTVRPVRSTIRYRSSFLGIQL